MAKKATEELRVPLFIPKYPGITDDVTIVYNGRFFTIKRGVEVMVPPGVEEIYLNAIKADEEAEELKEQSKI